MKASFKSIRDKQMLSITGLLILFLFASATILPTSCPAAAATFAATGSDDKKEKKDKKSKDEAKDKKKYKESKSSSSTNSAPSVELTATALDPGGSTIETVHATVETEPVPNPDDAADDPAIWVNPADPSQSTIIGTDKKGGLGVYDLSGKQLQYLKIGRVNNVDIRPAFKLGGEMVALAAGGNRTDNTIALYRVNPKTRLLEDVAARKITTGEVYGSCMYRSTKTGKHYYFVTSKTGAIEQWELFDNGSGKVDARKVRSFKLGSVVEGCVADDELGHFYAAEELIGIWKFGAEPDAGDARTQVDKTGSGGHLVADVEGLTIVYGQNGTGFLIASSQGNHSFVVYRREGKHEHVKTFRIKPGDAVDGTEETDGIDAVAANLGPAFPHGLFVAQDGFNDKGNQNFKLVPLERVIGKPAQ